MGITQVRNVREGELWNAPQFSIGGVAGNLVKVDRNEQSRFFRGSVRRTGTDGSALVLLLPLVLLVGGKELFPERRPRPPRRHGGRTTTRHRSKASTPGVDDRAAELLHTV